MEANRLADAMGISPGYKQKETERWNTALQTYHGMIATSGTQTPVTLEDREMMSPEILKVNSDKELAAAEEKRTCTPPNSPSMGGVRRGSQQGKSAVIPASLSGLGFPVASANTTAVSQPVSRGSNRSPPPLNPMSTYGRQASWTPGLSQPAKDFINPSAAGGLATLELEAVAAVHELAFAVQSISVSDLLPRTKDLIFVNVTTLEGQPHCLELTSMGWRVTSMRLDCMNGDLKHIDLHTRYFDSIYALLDFVSPEYRKQFSNALTERLKIVEQQQCLNPNVLNSSSSDPGMDAVMGMLAQFSVDGERSNLQPDPNSAPQVRVQHPSGDILKQRDPVPFWDPIND